MKRTCPNCGAEATGTVCEYCGTNIPARNVAKDVLASNNSNDDDSINFRVVPFIANQKQALSIVRKEINDAKAGIRYKVKEMGQTYRDLPVAFTETRSIFVPVNVMKDADKVVTLQCNCLQQSLPRWFPTSISGKLWKHHAYYVFRDKEDTELNRADDIVEIKEAKPVSNDKFIVVDEIAYIPLWVVEGMIDSKAFSAFVYAGDKDKPILVNLKTEEGNLKQLLRKQLNFSESDYEKIVSRKATERKKNERKRAKRNSFLTRFSTILGAILGLVGAYWLNSLLFHGDAFWFCVFLFTPVGALLGFLISYKD